MADYLGSINNLPYTRSPQNDGDVVSRPANDVPDFIDFCRADVVQEDFFQGYADPFVNASNPAKQKIHNFFYKVKNGIKEGPEKLVTHKLTTLIQPETKYPVDVEHLSKKMKIEVMKLYEYAQKEGIEFQIGQASRPEPQQEAMQNDPVIGKYAAKYSPHVQHIAIDIHIVGKDLHDAQADLEKLGKYWKKLTGGRWGGDWYGKQHEPWHFDLERKGQNLCLSQADKSKTLGKG